MLVDNINLIVKAGNGGDGAATFLRSEGKAKGGPDGGNGGNGGNIYFQGSTNINDLREFRYKKRIEAQKGTPGKEKKLFLELRLIADVGLIGLPNAGKSSLLSVLTNATPKIGAYPFTTLEPNIGMLNGHAIADIPGLIEGASKGKGLGVEFLKHIEKTKVLVHCIDSSEVNPEKAYETVRNEFKQYNILLLDKPEIILLTKTDLVDEKTFKRNMKILKKKGKVLTVSIYNPVSLNILKQELEKIY